MNNLLFTALLLVLLYYFFYYLPQQKQISNPPLTKPLTHSQSTQTNPILEDSPELAELKTKNQALEKDYQSKLKEQKVQITQLQTQIRDLAQRPLPPTNSKSTQTETETELTSTLDTLIKNIQDLNNSLD